MILLLLEEPRYVSFFWRSELTPDGIASSQTIDRIRRVLREQGIITEYRHETRPRLYIQLTEKGRKVAEHLKAIEDLLSES